VEVKKGTPNIVVDKLNDYFNSNKITDDDNNVLENGGAVEIKLIIEKAESNATNAVDMNAYYAKYVAWANENGIIKGIGGNKFAPDAEVTRE